MVLRSKSLIIVAILGFLIVACGGGGQNNGGSSSRASHLFYKSGSISMVDPANPSATPVVVESGVTKREAGIFFGELGIDNRQLTNWHMRTIIYVKGDGKLYKINTLRGASQAPSQVSNEAGASIICDNDRSEDLTDHNRSVYLYELPGNDDNCLIATDNIWKMVRVGMTSTDNPIPAKKVVMVLWDASVAIVGFLAIDGQKLVRCDQNFQNCSDVIPFVNEGKKLSGSILQVDDKLYHYNVNTSTLSSILHTFSGGTPASVPFDTDGTDLYFTDGVKLLRLPRNGSTSASLLVTESGSISKIFLTTNRAAYIVGGFALKSIGKTGVGTATELVLNNVFLINTSENRVYYNKLSSTAVSSGVINDDGTGGTELPDSFWNGQILSSTVTTGRFPLKRIIRAEGCSVISACRGATLKSFDVATNNSGIILGRIPEDMNNIFLSGFEDQVLGVGNGAGNNFDMFFANANQTNSLKRITKTPTVSEIPIGF